MPQNGGVAIFWPKFVRPNWLASWESTRALKSSTAATRVAGSMPQCSASSSMVSALKTVSVMPCSAQESITFCAWAWPPLDWRHSSSKMQTFHMPGWSR